jgi:hypothetical protein
MVAAVDGSNQAKNAVLLPINTVQPADPSASLEVSAGAPSLRGGALIG